MKKLTAILLSAAMIFGLAACGNSSASTGNDANADKNQSSVAAKEENSSGDKNTDSSAGENSGADTENKKEDASGSENTDKGNTSDVSDPEVKNDTDPAADNETVTEKKVLVVYFSATGSTRAVAKEIAAQTNGELFELKPEEEYSDGDLDYDDPESRVCKEHVNERLQDVALKETTTEAFQSADVVFLGYPIWWSDAAWPVNNFVKKNDFTGKTVIPFCTSASSGIGNSGQKLAEMAGTGDWKFGKRFSSGVSAADVQTWVKSLDLTQ